MSRMTNKLMLLCRTVRHSFRSAPYSSLVMIAFYLLQSVFPAIYIRIEASLFDTILSSVSDSFSFRGLFVAFIPFLVMQLIEQVVYLVGNVIINVGVYEKYISFSRELIQQKTAKLPLICYENIEILNAQKRAEECVNLEKLSQLFMSITVLITSFFSLVCIAVTLIEFSGWFCLISLISAIPYFFARIIRGREFYYLKFYQAPQKRKLDYYWSLFTSSKTIKEIKVFGASSYLKNQWKQLRDEVNSQTWNQQKKDSLSLLMCEVVKSMGYGIGIFVSFYFVIIKYISVGTFGACISAFSKLQEQTKSFLTEAAFLPELFLYANDYFSFLDLPIEEKTTATRDVTFVDEIKLQNVSFRYPNCNYDAIHNINFSIKRGETIVILGENGSGKTTLSKVIAGLYDATGTIAFDGVPLSQIKKQSLYRHISIVLQNYVKYLLSLKDNIVISDLEQSNDERKVWSLISCHGLASLINSVGGCNVQIGKQFGGLELSGGQWQRLSIARGDFRESDMIILDEPTSAIDPLHENEMLCHFVDLSRNRTTIIVSHRVGLCKVADRIVVMKAGSIIEVGSHEELLVKNGEYAKLFKTQKQWYEDR